MLRLAVLLLCGLKGFGSELCLEDGVPESQRKYIQDGAGIDIPIGIFESNWASSWLLNKLTEMLVQEVMGYHAKVDPRMGANGASCFYALPGCMDFDNKIVAEKQCGINETTLHISVDSWVGSYASAMDQFNKEFPRIASVDLGSMGYAGEESMYVSQAILNDAYGDSGLALDFYKSYNTTHHNPRKYFDSIHDVDLSELEMCNETDMSNPSRIGDYAKYSGDYDGVVSQADGTFVAKCTDNRWWYAPACRQNSSQCIPLFTSGNGWKLQALMQWSTAYGMPTAIALSKGYSTWMKHVKNHRALHYWWVPDSTFIDMLPEPLTFARHSATEWLEGDKKSGAKGSYVSKLVSHNLQAKAGRVREFVSNMNFELPEVQRLLLELDQLGSTYNVSCKWMKENRDRWTKWKPVETSCYEGFGLIDASGSFVTTRAEAVGCGLCQAGSASEELIDDQGRTFQCKPCAPGYSQANTYSTQCEPCPKGTSASSFGSTQCTPCSEGFYQPETAQTSCISCGASRTTLLLGASSLTDCVCDAGNIEDQSTCVACHEDSMHCPKGSTVPKLEAADGTTDLKNPFVKKGYFSNPLVPLDTYKCSGELFCPGGSPGTCFGDREGLTCGDCKEGYYWTSEKCAPCGAVPAAWALSVAVLVIGVCGSYYMLTSSYTAKASVMMCTTAALGMLVALFQNLGVLNTVSVEWPAGLRDLLDFASVFTFNLDALGFSCAAGSNVARYVSTASFFWIVAVALPTVGLLTNLIPILKRRGLAWEKFKTISTLGQFLQVGFTTMCNVGLMPFMCYRHPTNQESILKYPNVFCRTEEHTIMRVFGVLVMFLAFSFFIAACYAAYQAPRWSGKPRLAAIRFLIFRFRPNVWYFGLVLLARGPLLSMPGVIATNMPSLQLTLMHMILLGSLCLQLWFLPWKSPILNLVDGLSVSLLVMLLAGSLGYADNSGEEAARVLALFGTVISSMMVVILGGMVMLGLCALFYRSALGSSKELRIMNLGKVPEEKDVFQSLLDVATFLKEDGQGKEKTFISDLGKLSVYDLGTVMRAINILADDLNMAVGDGTRKSSSSRRIATGQRTTRSQNSFSSENEKVTEAANEPTESPDAAAPAEKEKTQSAFV
ncbi:unnamed protein product [Durusdinium trenchii]|uniref:Tyrosine-protein kinase ephrin type A/B receptor-like domain-containing protein n=1 Tax=Durusdinium trenchii TaxID=1381693 RepID=A0ABP0I1G3_9DINO